MSLADYASLSDPRNAAKTPADLLKDLLQALFNHAIRDPDEEGIYEAAIH